MNTCFWHNFLPVCRMDGIFPTDGMFVFCHTDYTDCTDFFLNQNEKNEKEHSLMSLGWHESSYLNQILKYWKRTSCFLNQW